MFMTGKLPIKRLPTRRDETTQPSISCCSLPGVTLRRLLLLAVIALTPVAFAAVAGADVSILKSGPSTVTPGGTVTYTLTVTNGGPDPATAVQLNDALPAGITFASETQNSGPGFSCSTPTVGNNGTITCSIASLASGTNVTFTIVGNIPSNATAGTTFANTATVSTTASDPDTSNNSSTSTATVITEADLTVTKSGPNTAAAGTDVAFDVTVTNN